MRVMIDTNILLSALIFNSSKMTKIIEYIVDRHTLILSSYVIDEAQAVITRKSQNYRHAFDSFISELFFEMISTPKQMPQMPPIRDEKDKPVLASAIIANVDILITGDKDFFDLGLERPEIMTPAIFAELYIP